MLNYWMVIYTNICILLVEPNTIGTPALQVSAEQYKATDSVL